MIAFEPRVLRRHTSAIAAVLLALVCAVAPGKAMAAEGSSRAPLYRVEMLVFRALAAPGGEDWAAPPSFRGFGGDPAASVSATAPPTVLKIYGPESQQLGSAGSKLRASGQFRVIAHAAWLQTATPWGRHAGIDLAELGIRNPELSGTVYLERGTLLHFGVDLKLGSNPGYRMSELQRIKFNETSYFDHPAFGVIAIVSPVRGSSGSIE
jgi:hypothetical protein